MQFLSSIEAGLKSFGKFIFDMFNVDVLRQSLFILRMNPVKKSSFFSFFFINYGIFSITLFILTIKTRPGASFKWNTRALCGHMNESVSQSADRG